MASFYDLLVEDSETDSGSSRGSHHPLHECFMVYTPDGHVEDEDKTPPLGSDDEVERNSRASPRLQMEQLMA